jgi:catechol 2,3-dioxygenase-like lactoylglutathione lyase family enzyme
MVMKIALHHVGLLTTKIDESIRFYTHFLGMHVSSQISRAGTPEIVYLDDGSKSTKILLCLIGPPFSAWMEAFFTEHGPMLALLGFEVDDVDACYQSLRTEGIEIVTALEDFERGRGFYLRDPAGIMLDMMPQGAPIPSPSKNSGFTSAAAIQYNLSHTNITCRELTVLENFYVDKLGMKIVVDRRKEGMIFLADPTAIADKDHDIFPLELFGPPGLWEPDLEFLDEHGAGLQYLCFAVDDVDKAYQELRSKGVEFHLTPTETEGNRVAFFKDPNGIDIEILHPLPQTLLRG